ncbi:MAG: bifunctional diaminohydroxyphosphoribosylaminopyrimidine deaminase/5-amino-6-(5-phosphoribosylamino)uracil reductase RibD [Lachnospiraceae bacterium]|nr:bifunctional diaminohydroxyphosphoribosylaminopyrimidine deaminase/5-amino-6-(5-phosphoribosylamino)uracil reductase RibD [Lachnospiraceae bacterium]
MTDEQFMRRAIELAGKAEGFTNPNPMVGAVIVKNGRIIGEGYHRKYGERHAERDALASLKEPAQGATMYVTLEPCCHYGKQPPCTEAIIENGIARVVVGSYDPNPLVSGKGFAILRAEGIEVVEGFLKEECDALNPVFFKYIKKKEPYVVLKYAMTMDGKIATRTGASKWITNEGSREEVHKLRHKYMAIMAGINTVLTDDPMLNVRLDGLKSPVRVILDSKLRLPLQSRIVRSATDHKTIVAYSEEELQNSKDMVLRRESLESAGILTVRSPEKDGEVDLSFLLKYLGEQGIDSVLAEGGGTVNDSLIREKLVDRIEVFIAPKVFGGRDARTPVEGLGISNVEDAAFFRLENIVRHDNDIQISYVKA